MTAPLNEIEKLADAILRASGSSLRNYTMPATRAAIIAAAQEAHDAGRRAGWKAFGELMMHQLGPNAPKIREG